MLTRSVYVRKLQPVNVEEYNNDPANYQGEWGDNPEGEIGEIVSQTFIPIPDANNQGMAIMKPIVGVCWSVSKIPAIAHEDLAFLVNVDDEFADDEDEEEEEIDPEPEDNFVDDKDDNA